MQFDKNLRSEKMAVQWLTYFLKSRELMVSKLEHAQLIIQLSVM